jgi:hypothetical protein
VGGGGGAAGAELSTLREQLQVTQQMLTTSMAMMDRGFSQFAHQLQSQAQFMQHEQQERTKEQAALLGVMEDQLRELLPGMLGPIEARLQGAVQEGLGGLRDDLLQRLLADNGPLMTRLSELQEAVAASGGGGGGPEAGEVAEEVLEGLQEPLTAALRAGMEQALLPAVETTLQRCFVSVNETLEKGLQVRAACSRWREADGRDAAVARVHAGLPAGAG